MYETEGLNGTTRKGYVLNKDYTVMVMYLENKLESNCITIRVFDINGDALGETTHDFKTLSQIKVIALSMILTFDEYGQVTPKTELQQIKDILIEKITVDQAEKYSYVAIDDDNDVTLYVYEPKVKSDGWWYPNGGHLFIITTIQAPSLQDYIQINYGDLCFLIADLKGQN